MSKVAAVLLGLRHTKKGGEMESDTSKALSNDFIGNVGRACISNIVFPNNLTSATVDLFGSGLTRTHQELLELVLSNNLFGNSHDPLLNMGTDAMFKHWQDLGLIAAAKEAGSNLAGLEKLLGFGDFDWVCKSCANDIRDAFRVMANNYAIGVFHTPTIEAAAKGFGYQTFESLAEDTGIVFILLDDDTIQCSGPWKSGDTLPNIGDEFVPQTQI